MRRPRAARWLVATLALALLGPVACSDPEPGSPDGEADAATEAPPDATSDATSDTTAPAPAGDLAACPEAYREPGLASGPHDGFEAAGQDRAFHLLLPEDPPAEPAPLFVALTGTVQEEASFLVQSGLDRLPEDGWIVVAPVRNANGIIWGPWDAMRTPAMTQPNPDESLVLDLVACVSAHHAVDPDRVFVGGISVGGTFATYLLRRNSDLFAGGVVASGNFLLTAPAEQEPLDDMTVIVTWGGSSDQWTGCPDGRMGEQYAGQPGCASVDFVPEAAAAVDFYAGHESVDVLACSEEIGHIWISHATAYLAEVLASRPKGTDAPLEVGAPPAPLTCDVA